MAYREKNWTDVFPSNKYFFSKHLVYIGDWVRTYPLSKQDRKKFSDAAHDWAWNKGWRVDCTSYKVSPDTWEVECELTHKKRVRDFTCQ